MCPNNCHLQADLPTLSWGKISPRNRISNHMKSCVVQHNATTLWRNPDRINNHQLSRPPAIGTCCIIIRGHVDNWCESLSCLYCWVAVHIVHVLGEQLGLLWYCCCDNYFLTWNKCPSEQPVWLQLALVCLCIHIPQMLMILIFIILPPSMPTCMQVLISKVYWC